MRPITQEAYKLFHEGSQALSEIESHGIRIDEEYLQDITAQLNRRITALVDKLKGHKFFRRWKKHFGAKTNLGSRDQLGIVLFDIFEYPCNAKTETGRYQVDETALDAIDHPFVKRYQKLSKLNKARDTYITNIRKETINGFLHAVFNLHLVSTFRSSSDSPNFQNLPIRNPDTAKIIRRCFIPRDDFRIVEVDYGGIEVCGAAWYHHDPVMLEYISDPTKDMHRDMAMRCYKLKQSQVSKDIRYCGKNQFVFPQFYGDYYINCAKSLWASMEHMNLALPDGTDLEEHLLNKGITELGECSPDERPVKGTFEHHIQKVEHAFWNKRFKVYNEWKQRWWNDYQKKGYIQSLSGFAIEGILKRNEAINYPIQGVAFHCLLWSLIRLNKLLKKYKMKSLIIGQIHDSIVADVHKNEVQDYLQLANKVMTVDIKKHWEWIITPLEIEAEITPLEGSWFDKKEIKISA
jgi:DNA polymerase I